MDRLARRKANVAVARLRNPIKSPRNSAHHCHWRCRLSIKAISEALRAPVCGGFCLARFIRSAFCCSNGFIGPDCRRLFRFDDLAWKSGCRDRGGMDCSRRARKVLAKQRV
ncbi:hypothetical protein NDU88_000967 [Pleurodeles waltl]|uniref:Uncharacterized protein n=1 Tax=Pleurodeles waltl TaxID=8319 RepID=A0AAV7MID2_PLEWA|nr:hypothetical protein NDU88_000967 [Pleurodeles waltl]